MLGVRGLDLSGSDHRVVVGSFEHENQPSDSTKFGNFLDQLRDCQVHKKASIFGKNVESLDLTVTV
jgi:hypothetical protein